MNKKTMYGVLTLAFGALALWAAFHVSREVRGKRDWPTVSGQILERGLGEQVGTRATTVMPHVKYQYVVNGKTYTNAQVYLLERTGGDKADVQKLVDGLPDPVPVHYNPANPQQAYLLTNSMAWFWILLPAGILLALIGLVLLVGGRRS